MCVISRKSIWLKGQRICFDPFVVFVYKWDWAGSFPVWWCGYQLFFVTKLLLLIAFKTIQQNNSRQIVKLYKGFYHTLRALAGLPFFAERLRAFWRFPILFGRKQILEVPVKTLLGF